MSAAPVTVFVPGDASACSLGADRVARAIEAEAGKRGRAVRIVRNGSRGLYWLEPLVEVVTAAGRVAYGPVTPADVGKLLDAGMLEGGAHALRLGDIVDSSVSRQPAAPHRRAPGNRRSDEPRGLCRAWRLRRAAQCARHATARHRARHYRLRPARPRRRGVSHRHQVADGARPEGRAEIHHLQCRRGRLGHLLRSHAHGGRSVLCSSRA